MDWEGEVECCVQRLVLQPDQFVEVDKQDFDLLVLPVVGAKNTRLMIWVGNLARGRCQ